MKVPISIVKGGCVFHRYLPPYGQNFRISAKGQLFMGGNVKNYAEMPQNFALYAFENAEFVQ